MTLRKVLLLSTLRDFEPSQKMAFVLLTLGCCVRKKDRNVENDAFDEIQIGKHLTKEKRKETMKMKTDCTQPARRKPVLLRDILQPGYKPIGYGYSQPGGSSFYSRRSGLGAPIRSVQDENEAQRAQVGIQSPPPIDSRRRSGIVRGSLTAEEKRTLLLLQLSHSRKSREPSLGPI